MRLAYKIWIDENGRAFGEGPAALLDLIRTEGSLNKAAARLGMAYPAAWLMMKATEDWPLADPAEVLDRAMVRRIFPQGQMCTSVIAIVGIVAEGPAKMGFSKQTIRSKHSRRIELIGLSTCLF